MTKLMAIPTLLLINFIGYSQTLKPKDILQKSIAYHDPNYKWNNLDAKLHFLINSGGREDSVIITMKNSEGIFILNGVFEDDSIHLGVDHLNKCKIMVNGSEEITSQTISKHKQRFSLNCEGAQMVRNFWLYTTGLPMKLQDEGTVLSDEVKFVDFNHSKVYQIKADYPDTIWKFYFDNKSFKLVGCEFERKDNQFKEMFLMEGLIDVAGVKLSESKKLMLDSALQAETILVDFNLIDE